MTGAVCWMCGRPRGPSADGLGSHCRRKFATHRTTTARPAVWPGHTQPALEDQMHTVKTNPTDGPVHEWFGLSYSTHQVLPRTLMQSMPTEWQMRMVACLEEMHDAFQHVPQPEAYKVQAATEHIVSEMGFDLLEEAGITEDWYRGEVPPEGLSDDDLAEWRAEHEADEPTYHRDGREMNPGERLLLPELDPVPHYNRGRTYIEPRPA